MNISTLLKAALLATLLLSPLSAEEAEGQDCDASYNVCTEKCEKTEDSSDKCIGKCDVKYDKCLESEEQQPKESN